MLWNSTFCFKEVKGTLPEIVNNKLVVSKLIPKFFMWQSGILNGLKCKKKKEKEKLTSSIDLLHVTSHSLLEHFFSQDRQEKKPERTLKTNLLSMCFIHNNAIKYC